jgi:hypothetical protein
MTVKVWLLYLLISMPNMPSVKNNSFLYPNEEECMQALTDYLNIYERKSAEYKTNLKTMGYCLPFEAFPIQGMNTL